MFSWLFNLGILGAGGYWGYKNGKQDKLSKSTKRVIHITSVLAGTAMGVIYTPDVITEIYKATHFENPDFAESLKDLYYYKRYLVYSFGGIGGFVGTYADLGIGYLIGKGIGKLAGKPRKIKKETLENIVSPEKAEGLASKSLEKEPLDSREYNELEYKLKMRLVNGEIDLEKFDEIKKRLREQ